MSSPIRRRTSRKKRLIPKQYVVDLLCQQLSDNTEVSSKAPEILQDCAREFIDKIVREVCKISDAKSLKILSKEELHKALHIMNLPQYITTKEIADTMDKKQNEKNSRKKKPKKLTATEEQRELKEQSRLIDEARNRFQSKPFFLMSNNKK